MDKNDGTYSGRLHPNIESEFSQFTADKNKSHSSSPSRGKYLYANAANYRHINGSPLGVGVRSGFDMSRPTSGDIGAL